MSYSDVLPASMFTGEFQPALPMHSPRFRLDPKYITSVPDVIECELTETGSSWSSNGTVDHPSFARLRNYLDKQGYIQIERGWINGDRVVKEFYLNDVHFSKGDKFLGASAMGFHIERSEKHPYTAVEKEDKMDYHAELRNWLIENSYGGYIVCRGEVYNDSKGRFKDGDLISTSAIKELDINNRRLITRNTVYRLV